LTLNDILRINERVAYETLPFLLDPNAGQAALLSSKENLDEVSCEVVMNRDGDDKLY